MSNRHQRNLEKTPYTDSRDLTNFFIIAQYARYPSSNQSYSNAGGNSNNLNVPFAQQNNNYNQSQYNNASSMASPYSATSSPGYHSPNLHNKYNHNQPLKKYTLQPPPRKLPLSKSMTSLGYPDIFPQRPTQEEDILTESNVRHGFVDRPVVSVKLSLISLIK